MFNNHELEYLAARYNLTIEQVTLEASKHENYVCLINALLEMHNAQEKET